MLLQICAPVRSKRSQSLFYVTHNFWNPSSIPTHVINLYVLYRQLLFKKHSAWVGGKRMPQTRLVTEMCILCTGTEGNCIRFSCLLTAWLPRNQSSKSGSSETITHKNIRRNFYKKEKTDVHFWMCLRITVRSRNSLGILQFQIQRYVFQTSHSKLPCKKNLLFLKIPDAHFEDSNKMYATYKHCQDLLYTWSQ